MLFGAKRALIALANREFKLDPKIEAGWIGEATAFDRVSEFLYSAEIEARLYPNLRIPKGDGSGKHEIDLLLLWDRGLVLIEVKHWGGHLSRDPSGRWRQQLGDQERSHEDPCSSLETKRRSLALWLKSQAINFDENAMHCLVLLSNSRATCSSELARRPDLSHLASINQTLAKLIKKGPPLRGAKALRKHLERLPTWDEIELHGGAIWRGDILGFRPAPGGKAIGIERQLVHRIEVSMPRSLLQSFWQKPELTLYTWQGHQREQPLDPKSTILLQAAGQEAPQEIALLHIVNIRFGWRDTSYLIPQNAREQS